MTWEVHDGHGRILCEANDMAGALLGARTITSEEATHLGASRLARKDLIVTEAGVYHPGATRAAREAHTSLQRPCPDYDPRVDWPERYTDGPY